MKKSKIKFAIKKAMKIYYKVGLTNTAYSVLTKINETIDRAYKK